MATRCPLQAVPVAVLLAMALAGCSGDARGTVAQPPATSSVATGPTSARPPARPPAPTPAPPCGPVASGALKACPDRAAVGDSVTISGRDCHDRESRGVLLFLYRDGVDGAAEVQPAPEPAADGTFSVTWTIPPALGEVMNSGGGPTTPGAYYFRTKPATPGCTGTFTVT